MGKREGFSQENMKFFRDKGRRQMKKLVLFSVRTNLQGADGGVLLPQVTYMSVAGRATHPSKDAHIPTPEPVTQVTFPQRNRLYRWYYEDEPEMGRLSWVIQVDRTE